MRIIPSIASAAALLVMVLAAVLVDEATARYVRARASVADRGMGGEAAEEHCTTRADGSRTTHATHNTCHDSKHQPVKVTSLLANDAVLDR